MYLSLLSGLTLVAAHRRAHTQVRPYKSFSDFYERNLILPLNIGDPAEIIPIVSKP